MLQSIHIRPRIGYHLLLACAIFALSLIAKASAQTTAFTYQSRLNASGALLLNIVNAPTQFNLAVSRMSSNAGTNNLFAGIGAGLGTTTGEDNTFIGKGAGGHSTTGGGNTFISEFADFNPAVPNPMGNHNTLLGSDSGVSNPDAFDLPQERSVEWARHPEKMQQLKEQRIEEERTPKQQKQPQIP